MDLRIGLDLGSTAIKMVLLDNEEIICRRHVPTAPGQEARARQLIEESLSEMELAGTPLTNFSELSLNTDEMLELNSTCVVFAESEIVSLLAKGATKESIIKGLHGSIGRRVAGMMRNAIPAGAVYLDDGLAQNKGLVEALEDKLILYYQRRHDVWYQHIYGLYTVI